MLPRVAGIEGTIERLNSFYPEREGLARAHAARPARTERSAASLVVNAAAFANNAVRPSSPLAAISLTSSLLLGANLFL